MPWVAIRLVVNAIRVLERMVPDGALLFDHDVHDTMSRPGTGSLKTATLGGRIEALAAWANAQAAAHGLADEAIPPDPNGAIGTHRFRRSLAWHIARRPNGLVALAIQYGHLRTAVSGSYAARSRGGIQDLIDIETARAVADTVAGLHDSLEAGAGVSGLAARRAIKAAATAPRFAGTVITATTARRLIANEDAMIYDNPHVLLLCSNGVLTVVALAQEAEVPRNALTQRHRDLKAEFYARAAERGAPRKPRPGCGPPSPH